MKFLRFLLLFTALASPLAAQVTVTKVGVTTDNITDHLAFPSGLNLTMRSGSSVVLLTGAGLTLEIEHSRLILDELGTTRGSVIYRGASGYTALTPGTSGFVLKSQGAGADPVWAADEEGAGGADADAIHENVDGEIAAVADKTVPVGADHILIEDSAASNAKKDVLLSTLPISTPQQAGLDTKLTRVTSTVDPDPLTDDTTLGYVVGITWLNTTSGDLWQANDVTDGAAVWRNLGKPLAEDVSFDDSPTILDGVAGGTLQAILDAILTYLDGLTFPGLADIGTTEVNPAEALNSADPRAQGVPAPYFYAPSTNFTLVNDVTSLLGSPWISVNATANVIVTLPDPIPAASPLNIPYPRVITNGDGLFDVTIDMDTDVVLDEAGESITLYSSGGATAVWQGISRLNQVTATTQSAGNNTTLVATSAFVQQELDTKALVCFALTIDDVADSMDYGIGYVPAAFTISRMVFIHAGTGLSSPDIDVMIRQGTDRSATGTAVVTAGTTVTSSTTGSVVTSFNDATCPSASFLWAETSSRSGTTDNLEIFVFGTYD